MKAILKNGVICPNEPVPPDWARVGYGSIFAVQRAGEAG